ncbi:lycopene cyclase domain-containing protein [bacterium]|nr:lycopene cyclase domain-containing protein [bacterium]
MIYEYLIFNALIVAGPLASSWMRPMRYVQKWPRVLLATLPVAAVFIAWDIAVTGRHWWFNYDYTLPLRMLGLPLGEWLFFFTVPFACLLIWEGLKARQAFEGECVIWRVGSIPITVGFAVLGIVFWLMGKEYTALASFAMTASFLLDRVLGVNVFMRRRATVFLFFVIGLTAIFNMYLTARPVVLYGEEFQLGFRVITIPIEDFFYGMALLGSVLVLYEKLGERMKVAKGNDAD